MTDTNFDPTTGEIIDQPPAAADGGRLYPAANTLGQFLAFLEDGQFDADVATDLRDLAAELHDVAIDAGGKASAELTIKVKISLEGAIFYLTPSHSIKRPVNKRPRSVAWLTEDNRFTPHKPHQGQLFGVLRDVNATTRVRDA